MLQHHTLQASPETCHWGFFDAGLKPVMTVASGDTVTVECVSGGPDVLPDGTDRGRGRRARRCARNPDPGDRPATELGLHPDPAALRHSAGGFSDPPDLAHADRPPAR